MKLCTRIKGSYTMHMIVVVRSPFLEKGDNSYELRGNASSKRRITIRQDLEKRNSYIQGVFIPILFLISLLSSFSFICWTSFAYESSFKMPYFAILLTGIRKIRSAPPFDGRACMIYIVLYHEYHWFNQAPNSSTKQIL